MLFGGVIIWYSYYSCGVLWYGDITTVLFLTVVIRTEFFGWVISLQCYLVRLLFGTVIIPLVFSVW